jgi:integrase/recombinase XerD
MASPSRVRITGPLTPLIKDFAAELIRQGYRPGTAARQLQLIAQLSR